MAERMYEFPDGTEVEIRPVNGLAVQHLSSTRGGYPKKPSPPKVVVGERPNGKKIVELNPDDPDYQEELKRHAELVSEWEADKNLKIMKYLIERGVVDDPPIEYLQDNAFYLENMTDSEIKYFWIADLLKSDDAVQAFVEYLTGQTAPTEDGIDESMATFPKPSEREHTSDELSIQE